MSTDVRDAWESALAELEHTLEVTRQVLAGESEGTTYDVPRWTPPTIKGSMPADLMPRAQALLERQQALISEIEPLQLGHRQKIALLDKVTGATGARRLERPVYVDVSV